MHPFDISQKSFTKSAIDNQKIMSGHCWAELRVFLAVAKTKSFSKAAELLGTSQPTVGRSVKRLQDVVSAQLVIANRQGVILTPAGEKLAQSIASLDQMLFDITAGLLVENTEAEGHVRISITEGLKALFLAPATVEFSQKYPKIKLTVKTPQNIFVAKDNQADVVVGFVPSDDDELVVTRLGTIHLLPMASTLYVERFGIPTQENVGNHICIQCDNYASRSGLWDKWLQMCEKSKNVYYCDHILSHAMMVKSGVGIGLFGNYMTLAPDFELLDLGIHVKLPLYCTAWRKNLSSKAVDLVFQWICNTFSLNPWLGEDLHLTVPSGPYNEGLRKLFNIV